MKIRYAIKQVTAASTLLLFALSGAYSQDILEQYIDEGLKNNLVVQEGKVSLEQAENALKMARNYFLPTVEVLGDYTSGKGGRNISIPVGDLLNPVYRSLNQLTQSDEFPQIANVEQNFFPSDFYDARVRTSVPLFNTDLAIARSIRSKELVIRSYELKAYKRKLAFEIQEAYFKHLTAAEAVKIYEGALEIVERNVAINESLKRNGKGLPANVLRSKSEVALVKAELNNARNAYANSRKYFNFLLNRDLDLPIDTAYSLNHHLLPDSLSVDVGGREEISIAKTGHEINASIVTMNQLARLPKVNAFLDLGSQASGWKFNDHSTYYLFGVQVSIPLFRGFANNIAVSQSKLDLRKSELALKNTYRSLQMSADIARNDLLTARQNYRAADEQLKAAEGYFRLVEKGYQQGVNSLIEYLDARNQLTTSALMNNVRAFDMLIARARLERETASEQIDN